MRRSNLLLALIAAAIVGLFSTSSSAQSEHQPSVGLLLSDPDSYDGYTLFAPILSRTTYLIDNEGRLVHSWETGSGPSAYLLEDGSLIRTTAASGRNFPAGGRTGRVERVDWDGTLLWEFEYANADHELHHDLEVLPNGNVLMIAWERKSAAEALAAGRNPALLGDGEIWPEHVIEVQPTGSSSGDIVWEWHAWDHLVQDFDAAQNNYGIVADHPELIDLNYFDSTQPSDGEADWLHANGIDYNPDLDQIILSVRQVSEFWVIDHSTTTAQAASHAGGEHGKGGDLLYRWGNPQAYRSGNPADQQLFKQHDAHWIEPGLPGAGNILVFNNGFARPGGNYSSVDEIVPPVKGSGDYLLPAGQAYGPTAPVWSYASPNPSDFYSELISGADRLPNGNTLINSGWPYGRFREVTATGMTV
jgi:hypothetical protein